MGLKKGAEEHSAPLHKLVVPRTQADPSVGLTPYLEQPGGGEGEEP